MEQGLHITLASERLFKVWGLPITNTLITTWVVMFVLLTFAFVLGRRLKLTPGRVQSAAEMVFEYIFNYVKDTLGSEAEPSAEQKCKDKKHEHDYPCRDERVCDGKTPHLKQSLRCERYVQTLLHILNNINTQNSYYKEQKQPNTPIQG